MEASSSPVSPIDARPRRRTERARVCVAWAPAEGPGNSLALAKRARASSQDYALAALVSERRSRQKSPDRLFPRSTLVPIPLPVSRLWRFLQPIACRRVSDRNARAFDLDPRDGPARWCASTRSFRQTPSRWMGPSGAALSLSKAVGIVVYDDAVHPCPLLLLDIRATDWADGHLGCVWPGDDHFSVDRCFPHRASPP